MSRQFSKYVSDLVKDNLSTLINTTTNVDAYSYALYQLGKELGNVLATQIENREENICVACTVEDADFLAKGIIDSLSLNFSNVSLACFWNHRQQKLSIAPIIKKYKEPASNNAEILVVVKSVISGACVVKTNLTNLIQEVIPKEIFVVSPVMYVNASSKLNSEFPDDISEKFKYVYFAIDNEKSSDGNLIPGIGGNVYKRLGFESQEDKNKFTPKLVKKRRALLISI